MSITPKSRNNPKFNRDYSIHKYKTRYDRLLNILFYSDELPSDLYEQMNMSHENYRKSISILKQRNLIRTVKNEGTIGYILTKEGRNLTRLLDYMKYKSCLAEEKDRHYNMMKYRNRKRQFAYLYALLDRAGIPYESFAKPPLTEVTITSNKVYFYTALDFKRMLGIEATIFTGSRLLGFFVGRGQIIPVYRTNQMLKSFGSHETLVPEYMKRHFTVPVDTAVLICESNEAVADITLQIFQNQNNDPKSGINTAYYKNFYIFPSDDSFLSHFADLFSAYREVEQTIIKLYNVSTAERDSSGKYRIRLGSGFIDDNPILICAGNINVVSARGFIREAELNHKINYIVCKERDKNYIKAITKNIPIKIITI